MERRTQDDAQARDNLTPKSFTSAFADDIKNIFTLSLNSYAEKSYSVHRMFSFVSGSVRSQSNSRLDTSKEGHSDTSTRATRADCNSLDIYEECA